ncbi:MAG: 4a-hydroxytetrahydrobiopterin dehydratase [Pseudomonadales bacterium]|nr:4a-hydroxytetrahydrobiopterin dehydratase [Pseudomonadales bacterium]MBO6656936.1 4a-hydroxytetrahydrobiopterin dehydratase [Pseudomonadales bacterium]MBO6704187.1 4a-hydroxytetrahydrobiopterin dehydratase [Pseudomonadales bacterium]MBO7006006.1 4a-hydroxytetrahydrobiopterin dehydratase [Pseudomonadales bacterium]
MSEIVWKEIDSALVAELEFKDFVDAFAFMTEVAALAEEHQHHPEWSNVYNRVSIRLTTHDAGNSVTEKDRALAEAIAAATSATLVKG